MADLTTRYMGLTLKNPVMVASCGLTETARGVQKAEEAGAGAVVMKSVFEEQINAEVDALADQSLKEHPEWQGERTRLVYSFPTSEKLWAEYARLRAESLRADGDGHGGRDSEGAPWAALQCVHHD